MKKIICLSILFISVANTFAQKEVFDIVNYTPQITGKKMLQKIIPVTLL